MDRFSKHRTTEYVAGDHSNLGNFINKPRIVRYSTRDNRSRRHFNKRHSSIQLFIRDQCSMDHYSNHNGIRHATRDHRTNINKKQFTIKYFRGECNLGRFFITKHDQCTMEHFSKRSGVDHTTRFHCDHNGVKSVKGGKRAMGHIGTTHLIVSHVIKNYLDVIHVITNYPDVRHVITNHHDVRHVITNYLNVSDPKPPAGEILAVDEESLPLSPSYEKAQNFSALLASLNTTVRHQMGHDKNDFIQDCTFNGRVCTPEEDFATILDETYGNCFIFNSGRTRGGAFWTAKQPGPLHGLQLTLFLDPDEYLADLTPAAGARLLIHQYTQYPFAGEEGISLPPGYTVSIGLSQLLIHQHTQYPFAGEEGISLPPGYTVSIGLSQYTQYPFAGEEGISLPPGYTVSIGLSQTLLERKGGKYGPCTTGEDKGFYRLKNGSHIRLFPDIYTYSVKLCEKTCLQQQIVERCGCADPYIKIPDNERACHPRDPCRTDFKKLYLNGSLQCDCPEACSETVFTSTVGFGEWPAPLYAETFIDDMKDKKGTGFGNLGTAAEIREGFIQVTVYFENMNIEHIYETPSYEVENLLGDIGGQLGLWMGISIMTVIELAEFLTDVVLFLLYGRRRRAADSPGDGEVILLPRDPTAMPPRREFILLPRDFPGTEIVPNRSRVVPKYPIMKGSWRSTANTAFTEV
ncbi:PREDICTED: uncharacterized protein LOC109482193 [Branchiostoma belcheri]|uniref:Uncharacterized protein LOC109482193 n=1 Tax=Branchiostoma belcheri TaxID=7741 RepID=A0A6P4ZU93_BRABE|nr:PREDICTED: uncharacterized protein LOC109482193 [Branchiostoma belcheri]